MDCRFGIEREPTYCSHIHNGTSKCAMEFCPLSFTELQEELKYKQKKSKKESD
jgi:hypothetical protein